MKTTRNDIFLLFFVLIFLFYGCNRKEANQNGGLFHASTLWAEDSNDSSDADTDDKTVTESAIASEVELKITIELTNSYGVLGRMVGFYLYEPALTTNDDPNVVGYGEFRLDSNGAGKGTAGSYNNYNSKIPVDFTGHTNLRLYVILDRNQDYSFTKAPTENDRIYQADITVFNTTNLIIDSGMLSPYNAGFNSLQISNLIELTKKLDQSGKDSLILEIKQAMKSVEKDNTLISDDNDRENFLIQDAKIAAAYTCTTVARYIFIKAMEMIRPDLVLADTLNFPAYYIYAVDQGYVLLGVTTKTFCYVNNGDNMLSDYLDGKRIKYWYVGRASYGSDTAMMTKLYEDKPEIVLIREGDLSGGKHTLTAVLDTDGKYYLLDSWYTENNGKLLDERYGPTSKRVLWYLMSYIPK